MTQCHSKRERAQCPCSSSSNGSIERERIKRSYEKWWVAIGGRFVMLTPFRIEFSYLAAYVKRVPMLSNTLKPNR